MKIFDAEFTGSVEFQSDTNVIGTIPATASWAIYAVNAAASSTFPYTGSAIITGSLQVTGSISTNSGFTGSLLGTASYSSNSETINGIISTALITSGSTDVTQIISGSLIIEQNLTVQGTSSIQYVTSSQLNIGTNLITVNTNIPTNRFGGLAAIDSGSNPQQSGSILYDSVQDEWIFVHRGLSANVTSSHFMMGPETYNSLGDETYIPASSLVKSVGTEHMTGSNVFDDGDTVTINSNTQITGSLIVSGSNGYGIFSKGITLADLTNGFSVTGSFFVWRSPFPCRVVSIYAFTSGSSQLSVNARVSGSGNSLHLSSNITTNTNNLWISGGSVQNTDYSAGDSLEIIISGSNQYQASVQVDFIKR